MYNIKIEIKLQNGLLKETKEYNNLSKEEAQERLAVLANVYNNGACDLRLEAGKYLFKRTNFRYGVSPYTNNWVTIEVV